MNVQTRSSTVTELVSPYLSLDGRGLRAAHDAGHPVDPTWLDGTRYRGISLGLPAFVDRLLWKTFEKTFHREASGVLRGWNIRVEQTGLDGELRPRIRRGQPWTFGHYHVVQGREHLEVCYRLGANPVLDPTRLAADPLVAVTAGDGSVLLGATDLRLHRFSVRTPSYFLLVHEGALRRIVP